MKQTLVIEARTRQAAGSRAAGRLRRAGRVPAVVYGEGKPAQPLELDRHSVERILEHHRGEHMLVDLVVDGQTRKVLLQDVQYDPITDQLMHIDFHEISMTKKLRVEVPLEFVGVPIGVSQQGGVLDHLLRKIEIECLPLDIPDRITVDVSGLEVGRHLSVRDIQLDPTKYTVLTAPDIAIAAVFLPKAEEAAPAAAEAAAAAEPEVLTAKKTEEGAAEAPAAGKEEKKEAKEKEKK